MIKTRLNIGALAMIVMLFLSGCGNNNQKIKETSNEVVNTPVTNKNFATAETHRYFKEFVDKGAVNIFFHEEDIAVNLKKQTIIRSNIDMFYSHAIIDISEGATITLPKSDERLRLVQIIDENGYTTDVLYNEGTFDLKSNSGAKFVYAFMRTAADPQDKADQEIALGFMKNTIVRSKGGKTFVSQYNFGAEEVIKKRNEIITEGGKKYTDSYGAFGDIKDIKDHDKFLFGAAAGWGGLPEKDAVYWPISPRLGSSCAELTIQVPPVNRYWSMTVYDSIGWLAHQFPLRNSHNTTPNEDGTLTFHFGCGDDELNNIPITKNWSFVLRMYGPKEEVLNKTYKPVKPTIKK